MRDRPDEKPGNGLPPCAIEYIARVAKKIRYRRKVRQDVQAELTAHFEDELRDVTDPPEREKRAKLLIEEFGDAELIGVLCRRAKKRCRPLWTKIAIRSVQAVGIVLLYCLLCSLRLFIGSPSLKVDYLAWLTDRTRAGREESLNAKPYFDKAAQSLTRTELLAEFHRIVGVRPNDMNEPQRKILADLAQHNAEAFELLRQGVTKPYYWVDYERAAREPLPPGVAESSPTGTMQSLLGDPASAFNRDLSMYGPGYRQLAQAFHASILWKACQGDVAGALDDSLVLMDFGMHLEGRGTQFEQLVGIAIEAMGLHIVFMLLDSYDVAGQDLARIQARLDHLFAHHAPLLDMTGDKAIWLAWVQRTFTDDGTGNGRVLMKGLPLASGDWQDGVTSLLLFDYPDRREMISLIDAFARECQLLQETEPSRPEYKEGKARWMALAQKSFLLRMQAPAVDRLGDLIWRQKTSRRALRTAVAVLRCGRDKGVYPPTLDALVADQYMKESPIDPYSGKPFVYRRTGDGFLLYSWGLNLVDDGGRQGTRQNGQPRAWADNGDEVFWPVRAETPAPKTPVQPAMNEEKKAKYRAAAPLNHTVRIERMGSYLKLDYELIGTDGKKQDLWGISEHPELTFSVYRGDARVGIGKFEYG